MAKRNVGKATAVGATAGASGAVGITWAAGVIEQKYGIPAPIAAGAIGTVFAFVARWAARLNPHD